MAATVQGKDHKDTTVVACATQTLTNNARDILSQEDIATIDEVPGLPEHQKTVKDQSNTWINDIWPLITKTTAEIIDYEDTFTTAYDQLKDLLPRLEKDFQAKIDFVEILQDVLIRALQEKSDTAMFIARSISTFQAGYEPLYDKFKADFEAANNLLTKDNEEIINKQADLAMWKKQAFRYKMAALAAGIALPLTAAAIHFYGEGLLIGGGVLIAFECIALTAFLLKYVRAMRHVNDLTSQIKKFNDEVAKLTQIENQIDCLKAATDLFVATSEEVAKGWGALKDHLEDTVKSLQRIQPQNIPTSVIKEEMRPAIIEWGTVLEKAKALQPHADGKIDSKTSGDMVKEINDQAVKAKGA